MPENYYILLDLDPSVKDDASIDAKITEKQQAWSADRNHPTKGNIAQQNLERLADIRRVLQDPELRDKESKDAEKILAVQAQAKNRDLITAGSILIKNGEISEGDLKALLKKSKFKEFTEEEALKILKVKIKKEASSYKDDGIVALDGSVIKKIRTDLNIVKKKDLFHFLSLSPTSSCSVLLKKADEIYDLTSRNANKKAENTASNSLATACKTYLKDDEVKKRYQKSLEIESFSEIFELIDLAANDKVIDSSEFNQLILACTDKGIQVDRAEFYIYDYCKKKNITLLANDEKPKYKEQIQCGVCHYLNDKSANHCGQCASSLKISCPKCKSKTDSIDKSCTKCGFDIGNMPNAIYLIRNANVELLNGNFETADKYIKEAELYWPGHTELIDLKGRISKTISESKSLVTEIEQLLREKKAVEASKKLQILRSSNKSQQNISIFEGQIKSQVSAAESYCQKAKKETNEKNKLDFFLSALEECSDYNDAIIGVSSLPVAPPAGLKLSKNKKMIALQWSAPINNRALKYRIVRKENNKPNGVSDGEILTETRDLTYEDFGISAGKSYYYSVYSVRGKSFSLTAEAQGPIIITEEVQNISVIAGDSTLSIKWQTPALVKRIEIYRSEHHSFPKFGEGKKMASHNTNSFTDTNLTNEKEYFYSIFSIFEDCTGKEHISDGNRITSIPSSPPSPVIDLKSSTDDKRIHLNWTAPSKGNVQILRSQNKLNYAVGSVLPSTGINKLGDFLINNTSSSAFFDIDFQGQILLTPFTIHNGNAIVGQEISITSVEDVSRLKAQLSGGRLYLEWDWPKGCDLVQIKYSHDRFPNNGTSNNATSLNFTREQYKHNEGFIINQPVKKDYYFTVYTCSKVSGKDFLSNGVNELLVNSEIVNINYKVVVKKFLKKSAFLDFKSHQTIQIPEIMVVLKYAGIPINKSDGTCIMNIKNVSINNSFKIEIPFNHVAREKYIRLFFTDDDNNKKIKLLMPKKEDLELY